MTINTNDPVIYDNTNDHVIYGNTNGYVKIIILFNPEMWLLLSKLFEVVVLLS